MNTDKDKLFQLVKSLTKSEKRQFRLYTSRLERNNNANFVKLFDLLDKAVYYNEKAILEKTNIKKQQLSNSKANLYHQILVSLRLNPFHQNVSFKIREQLDHASILYYKGLYKQSLKILDKARNKALNAEMYSLAYQVLEFEKNIESQYRTYSSCDRAVSLVNVSNEIKAKTELENKMSNLSLEIYDWFLKNGYARSGEDEKLARLCYEKNLPVYDDTSLTFMSKLHLYKAKLWMGFICQDFLNCYRYSRKLISLFDALSTNEKEHSVFYLKGINALLESLFYLRQNDRFLKAYELFRKSFNSGHFDKNENIKVLSMVYLTLHRMNVFFLTVDFKKGVAEIPSILSVISTLIPRIDNNQKMLFYYKIACLHFGVEDYERCILYLDKILVCNKDGGLRQDLVCYTRILHLVAHYEAGDDFYIDKLVRDTYKYLLNMNHLQEVQKKLIVFLRKLTDLYPTELKKAFERLYEELLVFKDHPYEKRAFLYLDIISWLESHIKGVSITKIMKNKNF